MFETLVPDAKSDDLDLNHTLLASAETVTIQPGQVQTIHTGHYTTEPLAMSFRKGPGKFDMCILLTTAMPAEQEVRVAILNRGTEPVVIGRGEWLVVTCRLAATELLGAKF